MLVKSGWVIAPAHTEALQRYGRIFALPLDKRDGWAGLSIVGRCRTGPQTLNVDLAAFNILLRNRRRLPACRNIDGFNELRQVPFD